MKFAPRREQSVNVTHTSSCFMRSNTCTARKKRNIQVRSRNHCCCARVIIITYSEFVSIALPCMQSACVILYCHVWHVWLYLFFLHSHKRPDFRKKKSVLNTKCVFNFSITFVWNISHSTKNWARCDEDCISVLMQSIVILVRNLNFLDIFSHSNIKFHENLSSGSRVVPRGRTDRQTDMPRLRLSYVPCLALLSS